MSLTKLSPQTTTCLHVVVSLLEASATRVGG